MSNRRDFLWPQAGQSGPDPAPGNSGEGLSHLPSNTLRLSTEGMAADFEVIWNPGPTECVAVASAALEVVAGLEEQISVYRPHSELSRLNQRFAGERVRVEPRLFDLLLAALRWADVTEGAFDPTAGAVVGLWRQCRRDRRLPSEEELRLARGKTGWRTVRWNAAACELWVERAGVELNLNAMGKGYALDRMAEILDRDWPSTARVSRASHPPGNSPTPETARSSGGVPAEVSRQSRPGGWDQQEVGEVGEVGVTDLERGGGVASRGDWLIHGGYSSLFARGSVAGGDGWPISVSHPQVPRRSLGTLWLKDRGLSTSGSGVQFYRVEGRRLGHLIDPRSGWPAEGLLSVTVTAPTAAEAEALSTAFFVLGVEKAVTYCHNHPEVAALLFPTPEPGRWTEPVLCNLSESDWMPNQSPQESR